ncbi:MAG: hypothetical protein ACLVJ6_14720 [Merdibacter sp.]
MELQRRPMPLTIPAADVTLKRYDAVVLEVNTETATRANSIKIVSGNPGSDPSKPTLTNTEKVHQHALAYILVNAGATSINAGNIENVIGKTECPFVTGLPGPADISDLFEQWEYDFDVWFANLKAQLTDNVAANLQAQIDELKESAYKTYTGTTLPASSLEATEILMSKFSDKEFILLNRAKDLYIYTSEAVGNEKVIPRRRRYPTGQRLETMAMEILQKCHLANTTDLHRAFEERQRLQTEVIALCLTLEQLIDALKASKAYPGINQHKADIWIQHSLDVRYLCAAWRDRELERHLL